MDILPSVKCTHVIWAHNIGGGGVLLVPTRTSAQTEELSCLWSLGVNNPQLILVTKRERPTMTSLSKMLEGDLKTLSQKLGLAVSTPKGSGV